MIRLVAILFFACSISSYAQELNFIVSINANQVQTSDRGVFKDMKNAFDPPKNFKID